MRAVTLLLLLAFLFPVYGAWAQTGRIAGQVTDGQTGEPIPGVNVVIVGTNTGTATGAEGNYSIINVAPGTYSVRASFIGYTPQVVEGVEVNIDLTTTIDFELQEEALGLEEVTVTAQPPVIQKDVSSSQTNINPEDIQAGRYQDVENVITAQPGVNSTNAYEDRPQIRGSSFEESKFVVDGVDQGDALSGRPNFSVNLDAVQQIKVQTGAFSAEYGNVRSGLINVVTKEGGDTYEGTLNVQYSPAGLKHFGPMMYGFDSPVVEPFVKAEAGAFSGNDFFEGWEAYANETLQPGEPHYGEPMEVYARYLWRHRSEDAIEELQRLQQEGVVNLEFADELEPWQQYGNTPDWDASATLGGPVPFFEPVKFFVSFDGRSREYARTFSSQSTYETRNVRAKLTARPIDDLKVNLHGFYSTEKGGSGGQGPGRGDFVSSDPFTSLGDPNKMWYPNCAVPGQRTRQIYGMNMVYTRSTNTFFELKFSHGRTDYQMLPNPRDTAPIPGTGGTTSSNQGDLIQQGRIGTEEHAEALAAAGQEGWENWRDWAKIKIGEQWYDEGPKGYGPVNWRDVTGYYRMESCNLRRDNSYERTYDLSGNVTSQLNQYNQLRGGFQLSYQNINQYYEAIDPSVNGGSIYSSHVRPWEGALYLEDKLEYEGFIANVGVRADWTMKGTFPVLNGEEGESDSPYSEFLLPGNTDQNIESKISQERISQLRFSPRVGVSHPITEVGKIFFNYGHFYEWPSAAQSYNIQYDTPSGNRVVNIGNPALDPPRTIQYEVGYEQNLFDRMSLRLTGYYKDISGEIDNAVFNPLGFSSYNKLINMDYRDIRGLEAFLELRRGTLPYVSGFASLNYLVESEAEYGYETFYEDETIQPGLSNTEPSQPDVRPILKLSADFHTPEGFGPQAGAFAPLGGWNLNVLYTWQRGEQFTWNPASFPLVENNLRWSSDQRVDLRIRKTLFSAGGVQSSLYVDVVNLFNQRNLTAPFGNDYSGGWAWDDHQWWNNQLTQYMESLGYGAENQNRDGSFDAEHEPGDWEGEDVALPGFSPWHFLERRDIYFGAKFTF